MLIPQKILESQIFCAQVYEHPSPENIFEDFRSVGIEALDPSEND